MVNAPDYAGVVVATRADRSVSERSPVCAVRQVLSLGVCLLAIASGCGDDKNERSDREMRADAEAFLQSMLATNYNSTDDFSVRCRMPGVQRGLQLLASENWKVPTILIARLSRPPDGWIDILGLDGGGCTRGIFIQSANGERLAFRVFEWFARMSRTNATFMQKLEVCYEPGRGEPTPPPSTNPHFSGRLFVPRGFLEDGEVRVGLILEDGSDTEAVTAYSVRSPDKPVSKSK